MIVTFIDPLCRNFCPLEAQVLNQMERQIPAAHRPVILAVSVDVYANARRYLLQDDREWRLVPEWRWAIGRPADLAAVWKNYRIAVKVDVADQWHRYISHRPHRCGVRARCDRDMNVPCSYGRSIRRTSSTCFVELA